MIGTALLFNTLFFDSYKYDVLLNIKFKLFDVFFLKWDNKDTCVGVSLGNHQERKCKVLVSWRKYFE